MGIDFDILEHCKKVRADHGPPYTCPIDKCSRTYRSVCGLQYHLKSYDHDNPTPLPVSAAAAAAATPKSKKGRGGARARTPAAPEPLSYEEAQRTVQFEVAGGQVMRWNIDEPLEIVSKSDLSDEDMPGEFKPEQAQEPIVQLPEASYRELDDYAICDAPARPNAYIRFIEKSVEELDGEVEYDVDEEDTTWLQLMNEKRESSGLAPVSVDSLELLMDRLEKESYFQASVNGNSGGGCGGGAVVDDDAVCCICMDGECQNTNVILFCDMCNLAVHQDCYGVPYIPEGQWLCRRCLQSPSRAVDCVLCPNQGGAFKQTDRSLWAHVVCALWIPEVRFANTVFLEPIDSIETIPPARWKLTCYVCKQRSVGACIQCHKTNCYSAFHVTCAQQAGLYMKMDTVKDGGDSQPVLVQKIAYCDVHAPADNTEEKKEDARQKMKKARKMLAKKRTSAPVILIPTIPPERVQEIGTLVSITKKSQFIQRLIAYWTLKRQFRNGVPLLRRLQSAQQGGSRDSNCLNVDTIELCRQLKYWQCLRQDLERARLLCELVRKREKMKLEATKVAEKCFAIELKPLQASLRLVLDLIAAKDTNEIFSEPVDLEEVPDYSTVVTEPMDLSTMRRKLDDGFYVDLRAMEQDFDLMIANCLAYNNRDTVFYRAAIKMRDQCGTIFRQSRKELESCGLLLEASGLGGGAGDDGSGGGGGTASASSNEESLASDIDRELEILQGKIGVEVIVKLEELLIKSQALKHGLARAKRVKVVRSELIKARKVLAANTDSSQSDGEENDQSGVSPSSGVNRRTAVLFTRKAHQAGLKNKSSCDDKDSSVSSFSSVAASGGASCLVLPTTTTITTLATSTTTPSTTLAVAVSSTATAAGTTASSSSNISTATTTTRTTLSKQQKKKKGRPRRTAPEDPSLSKDDDSTAAASSSSKRTAKQLVDATPPVPDSFKVYRGAGNNQTSSADENSDSGTSLSTCYSHELSEVDSIEDSVVEDEDHLVDQNDAEGKNEEIKVLPPDIVNTTTSEVGLSLSTKTSVAKSGDNATTTSTSTTTSTMPVHLKPLQLVWAKCRGYPWYPALIIDPDMPKGYVHKSVPLPSPPADVLALAANHTGHVVYLVLFFDAKRTWQWLPIEKLEILGLDQERDEAKANESRKPTDRKAVRKAYENALQYVSQISEEMAEDEDNEEEEDNKS